MEQEIIVLFARPYQFMDKENGRELKGVTMYYVNKDATNNEKDGFGLMPVKVSLENANDLKHIPGRYNAIFTPNVTTRGIQLRLGALEFLDKVNVWNLDQ